MRNRERKIDYARWIEMIFCDQKEMSGETVKEPSRQRYEKETRLVGATKERERKRNQNKKDTRNGEKEACMVKREGFFCDQKKIGAEEL